VSPFFRVTFAILGKDVRRELRTKETISSMFVFAILVVVVFNFTLALDELRALELGPGILWTAFVFAATLGLNRSFAAERDNHSLSGLVMAPVDRSAIYFGKLGSNLLFMLVMEAFVLPVFVVFFNLNLWEILPGTDLAWFALVLLLGTTGFTALGTILSAITSGTTMRDVLLPLMLLSFAIPVIVSSAEATRVLFDVDPLTGPGSWLTLLAVCTISYVMVSWMVFEYVLEE
jgi:heme exporter protein B